MRELKLKDIYRLSAIIDKMQVKTDLNKLMDDAKKQPDAQAYIGGQMIMILVSRLHMAQKEVSSFLADLTDKTVEELENLSIKEVSDLFKELFSKNDMSGFFNSAVAENE
jgi:hypothetical protein